MLAVVALSFSLSAPIHAALSPYLVKDITTNTLSSATSPAPWPVLNGVAYFTARDEHGLELWRSDGTAEGTWLVKDIVPGPDSSDPGYFAIWRNALWFTARVETNRVALFKSDGSTDGTVIVKDGFFGYPDMAAGQLTAFGDILLFTGDDGVTGRELWKSDGTAEGTVLVKDIWPGQFGSLPLYFTPLNGIAVFRASDDDGVELWRTDGTEEGTYVIKDIVLGSGSSYPEAFTLLGTNLLFSANNRRELWKTDGTTEGTELVRAMDISTVTSSIEAMTRVGTNVFFAGFSGRGTEIWCSDGTTLGTRRVADINPNGSSYPNYIADLNGVALFSAHNGVRRELWRSDGSPFGTWPVTSSNGVPVDSPFWLTTVGDVVYFAAYASGTGAELWRTDGTSNNTYVVKDIAPGQYSSTPHVMATLQGFNLLTAGTAELGWEIWRTDGTEQGTVLVKDINLATAGSSPHRYAQLGDTFFFAVDPGVLWKTDGTTAGTELVYSFQDRPSGLNIVIREMVPLGNSLIISAAAASLSNRLALWITDGTTAGTRVLKDLQPDYISDPRLGYTWSPANLRQVGPYVLFSATGTNGTELWRTDGTTEGTVEVIDILPGADGSYPTSQLLYHSNLFFYAREEDYTGIWRSDGTSSGTVPVIRFTNAEPYGFKVGADQLLAFVAQGTNVALWSSRGTPETTVMTGLLPPIGGAVGAASLPIEGTGYGALFAANDGVHGSELWVTDGTAAGTRLLKDIRPGSFSSTPGSFFNAGRLTYFLADDGVHGREIWCTDGTEVGTRLLKDLYPGIAYGSSSFALYHMAEVNGLVFFWGYEPDHGTELWMTDGTEAGTTLVADLNPQKTSQGGPLLSAILAPSRNRLYFTADDGFSGPELWAVIVPPRPDLTVDFVNKGLLIRATSDSARRHILERSHDLRVWTPVATNVAFVQFTQPLTGTGTNVFYRSHLSIDP